jgi:5-methyltetrahydrofolate--homocysteine methyltransferase
MSIDVRFTADDWRRVEQTWNAWWEGELERPIVIIEDIVEPAGITISNIHNLGQPITSFPLEQPVEEILDYYQIRLEAKRFHGDAWPRWFPNLGPGIVAGFLGARVRSTPTTVWFEPVEQVAIGDLRLAFNSDNLWWQRVQQLTRLAVARWDDRVVVAHTDLGGNLDILASLLTAQQLLFDLIDHPDEVSRLVGEITGLWLRYYDELSKIIQSVGRGTTPWATIWSPDRCYMFQSDFAAMISPRMFEQFVMPDLEACCAAVEHSFYHLDGKGQIPHVDLLLSLGRLDGIQWIPGTGAPPPEEWLELLKRFRDAGKLCQLYVSPEGARKIVRALSGRGFALYIDQRMAEEEANDFFNLLTAESQSN